jgi:hypothetical protein
MTRVLIATTVALVLSTVPVHARPYPYDMDRACASRDAHEGGGDGRTSYAGGRAGAVHH